MKKLCFIGMGNMASALCAGLLHSGKLTGADIYAFDPAREKLQAKAAEYGFHAVESLAEGLAAADTVLLACKPDKVEEVLREAGELLCGKVFLSIALGWDFDRYEALLPDGVRVQFIMPNTPALVGSGVFLFEEKNSLTEAEGAELREVFATFGKVFTIPSKLMGVGGALTGCGPAFVDLMIEAFSDAGVLYGLPRDKALAMTAAMIEGSAKLQGETGTHPGVLKDAVCSPGGSTIRGVAALEHAGFRDACIAAIRAIMQK